MTDWQQKYADALAKRVELHNQVEEYAAIVNKHIAPDKDHKVRVHDDKPLTNVASFEVMYTSEVNHHNALKGDLVRIKKVVSVLESGKWNPEQAQVLASSLARHDEDFCELGDISDLNPAKYTAGQMEAIAAGRSPMQYFCLIDDLDPDEYDDRAMTRISAERGLKLFHEHLDEADKDYKDTERDLANAQPDSKEWSELNERLEKIRTWIDENKDVPEAIADVIAEYTD